MKNMSLKCIVIDDEPPALNLIRDYISRSPGLLLLDTFKDTASGAAYLAQNEVDLVFLDINLPNIAVVDQATPAEKKPMVIFMTAHKDFTFDRFQREAIDYILKPLDFDRFSRAVFKAADYKSYKMLHKK
jgi:two-component SAPR family response regulator